MDDVGCRGDETSIFNCRYNSEDDCSHYEDVGIICNSELLYMY